MMRFLVVLWLPVFTMAMLACGSVLPAEIDPEGKDPRAELREDGGIDASATTMLDGSTIDAIDGSDADADQRWSAHAVFDGSVAGEVRFTEQGGLVTVQIDVSGLVPGLHGWHVRDGSSCTGLLGHWNPDGVAHGFPTYAVHHAGDLGNVTADASGEAHASITVAFFNIEPSHPRSVFGRLLAIDTGADDGSGTTGNGGNSVACGVIGAE